MYVDFSLKSMEYSTSTLLGPAMREEEEIEHLSAVAGFSSSNT
jgi:hypothetical protein